MNVTFITYYSSFYGANQSLLTLILGLKSKGVKCNVIMASHGPFTDRLKENKIPFVVLDFKLWFSFRWKSRNIGFETAQNLKHVILGIGKILLNINCYLKNRHQIVNTSPSLIYSNTSITNFGSVCSYFLKVPHIWHLREYGDLDYSLKPDLGWKFIKKIIGRNYTVSISTAIAKHFSVYDKLTNKIVSNGVIDASEIIEKPKLPEHSLDQIEISIIGTINHNKGQIEACQAMKTLIDQGYKLELHIYGTGNTGEIEKFIDLHNLKDHIFLEGYRKDIKPIILKSFCVLMCSEHEGFGRVTAEAMSLGVPVIGKNFPATNELISDSETGYLYSGDHLALSSRIIDLINSPSDYNSISFNALVKAKKEFTKQKYVYTIYSLIQEVYKSTMV